ncbi:putative dna topoisomerase ii [Phaeomoniella chlamydospora]|uniref:DNA topoisomerase 2 n=1 Tax=Phaeomoniella chlamydospora TaxID=158046 RepID=A0A0G2HLI6_PHACM|nr:putative dna topoisomerase ii [Phaeomoniella chlamydospora]
MDDSIFDDFGASSEFEPVSKAKSKAAPKPKKAAAPKAATKKAASATKATTKAKSTAIKKRPRADSEDEAPADEVDEPFEDESLLADTPPKGKKQKTTSALAKSGSNKPPLGDLVNEAMALDEGDKKPKKGKRVSEQYQKLSQLEHIIKRPDTYIGSVERTEKQMWVYNSEQDSMEFREVSFVPGLYKIFDEILVNAADNKHNDKNMDEIRVTIDREAGEISVWNNGRGIPIEIHSKEKIYIPEMIFGHLLTSSNYDDDQKKVTGGRNGYGAKLTNIFSTKFILETQDSRSKKKYKQTWTENMGKMGTAKITDAKGEDFTKVTFSPDFARFGMTGMDDDFEALAKRRVYDLAGTSNVKVKLNGSMIPIRKFKKYMELYTKAIMKERGEEAANDSSEIITEQPDPRWEIGFAVSDGSFQQVSFVNSISTTSGGTHVNYVADQIVAKLAEVVKKRNKGGAQLKPNQIRNHIFVFVNSLIENPAFTSQTKEQLTTKSSQFGSKCIVSDKFMAQITSKTHVVNNILHFAQQKADQILKKSDMGKRSRMNNPKLTDANKAGSKDGFRCTLVLTEGDSAKGLAMAGRAVAGPDLFGVFPLRGKMLNVRDASVDQIAKNSEIQNIKNFLGLQHKKEYTDTKGLRYGHLMIMTDQDHDGSHIKGLLINWLQVQYPSLLKIPKFLIEFITPIVKVYKGDPKNPSKSQSFFTMPEYEIWKEAHKHEKSWEHKYYKGLGTSTTEDAQLYFTNIDRHLKEFHTMQDSEAQLVDLAFSKKKADERKEWLRQFKPGTYLDHTSSTITYTDFINKELILFSMADNIRSIPSVVDGLKPGQRKVLFGAFKRNLKKDMKVVELAGYVSGVTAYQHGETSLQQTIVGLAQSFVGSNNVNCLEPSGNFGSRLQGGSDCASARYIYTRLSPFARKVFHPADEPLLKYNTDDERLIEPETYMPVVPMVLINGADGIGTGWSSSIPNYNPVEIVDNLKRMMRGEEMEPMQPWFRGFKGDVSMVAPDRYKFSGIIDQQGDNEVHILELPIRTWTQDFKDRLEEIIKADKIPSFIKDYKDYNTHSDVHFVIQLDEKHMKKALEEGLEEKFKLSKTIATSNLVAFDAEGRITKYAGVEDIMKEFFNLRLKYYEKRKQHQLAEMQKELEKFTNQARFVKMIIDGKLNISKKKKSVLISELQKLGFKAFAKVEDASKAGELQRAQQDDDDDSGTEVEVAANSYDYLLGMPLWSLTQERVDKLLKQIGDKEMEIDTLIKLSKEDLWERDLDEFIAEWENQLLEEKARLKRVRGANRRVSSKLTLGDTNPYGRRRKANDDDDDDFVISKPKKAATKKAEAKVKQESQASNLRTWLSAASDAQVDDLKVESQSQDSGRATSAAPKEPKAKPKPKPKKMTAISDDDMPDDDVAISKPTRPRTAAQKSFKYALSSDSDTDNGDDLLGDVSKMVKGIGSTNGDSSSDARALFSSSMSRPSSSTGLKPTTKASKIADFSVDADETDYSKLIPQQSPRRSILVTAKDIKMTDDEDEDDEPIKPLVETTAVPKATKAAAKPAAKGRAQPKKAASAKPTPLSPAAKAYAAKQAKSKKKIADDSDDDVDAMANDILDSPVGSEAGSPAPVAARPSRRAAATKKKMNYVVDDDDDESDGVQSDVESMEMFSDSD